MRYQIRGMALGAYRRDIDPACLSDEAAEAAIREALEYAREVGTPRSDGVRRLRAPKRAGAAWSRCYLVVGPSGDVIDIQPESPHGRGVSRAAHTQRRQERTWPVVVRREGQYHVALAVSRDVLTPDEARELAVRLVDVAERIDAAVVGHTPDGRVVRR